MIAEHTPSRPVDPAAKVFDRWAEVYDAQPNPLLTLEERTAEGMLPEIAGRHVRDIGCGTGRWLQRLERLQPASLTGIDASPAMLERARTKLTGNIVLVCADCCDNHGAAGSLDVVISSFVISYVKDLDAFARECARVLRPGGHLLLSDMHPATAADRGWTRGFRASKGGVRIYTHRRSIREISAVFARHGLSLATLAEPSFAEPERPIFELAGRTAEYESLANSPAIYVMMLEKRRERMHHVADWQACLRMENAPWSATPASWNKGALSADNGRFVMTDVALSPSPALDLSGYSILPGLINAHDHLEFAVFPNLGRPPEAPPYGNACEWAAEIHQVHAATIELHRSVPLEARLWWGALRNLLCGVTTVCHHNPLHQQLVAEDFPVRVVTQFGWAHSLAFNQDLAVRFRSTDVGKPFVLHAGEGTDRTSRKEFVQLDRLGILAPHTVLVHGVALGIDEVTLLNQRGVSLIVCPSSNRYLFRQTIARSVLSLVQRVALGSDSPLTAAGDLLDELRVARLEWQQNAACLYNQITTTAATMLHLDEGEGLIRKGGRADCIAIRGMHATPAKALEGLRAEQVELVVLGGRVHMASPAMYMRLPEAMRAEMYPLSLEGNERWVRAPLPTLFRQAECVLGRDQLHLGGKEVRQLATL